MNFLISRIKKIGKVFYNWWFKFQWNRQLKKDKKAGRWPI